MAERESHQAQREALHAAGAEPAGERGRALEGALARYLRLNAAAARRRKRPAEGAADSSEQQREVHP